MTDQKMPDTLDEDDTDLPREEMDQLTFDQIDQLGDAGNDLLDDGAYEAAAAKFETAFALVPQPFQDWEVSIWLLASLGESYFLMDDFAKAREAFSKALECPDAEDSPPILLRMGQCEYELGNKDAAAERLMDAYMGEGRELFADEDEKYYDYLNSVYELK
ncbi:MAG: hypothetical protein JWM96_802 [Alphaproteobacteria bacterium]|nr:hypothetical protein [Alphaproteobacteria bacterium]